MTKRIVIAGSRYFNNYDLFCCIVDKYLCRIRKEYELTILSGHCSGTDLMAERYANENNLKLEIFPADWQRFGRSAGPKRNKQMVDIADYAIAFSSGGRGTASLIGLARQKGIPIRVHHINQDLNNL